MLIERHTRAYLFMSPETDRGETRSITLQIGSQIFATKWRSYAEAHTKVHLGLLIPTQVNGRAGVKPSAFITFLLFIPTKVLTGECLQQDQQLP